MNPYEILGARKTWKTSTIKRAYRKLSKKHHPDVGGDTGKFQELSRAWAILRDPERREQYDKSGLIDEGSINNDFALMVEHLAQYVKSVITHGVQDKKEADIIALIIDAAQQDVDKEKEQREKSQKEAEALNRLKTRITAKDEKKNLFTTVIDEALKKHNDRAIKCSNNERAFTMLIEELSSYSCAT